MKSLLLPLTLSLSPVVSLLPSAGSAGTCENANRALGYERYDCAAQREYWAREAREREENRRRSAIYDVWETDSQGRYRQYLVIPDEYGRPSRITPGLSSGR
ncbi:hypothetical protein [Methylococcus capsulatus]|uniref:hypothetical protein n=1 Tax=Methylococcus capsulatus TaxID=414 RepID=UPI001C52789E|nr:hypothetical protein [Methylococcus capsulatus]QXP88186.1 hypothetical protein KW112_03330 [Methylococcus capsulatus]QXP94805.1 hypothetical protein KW113_06460 [Methylococcus capsulatus]UQN13222.1 hypothetical protein M3M30_05045 [Methylococcus capsulatus]